MNAKQALLLILILAGPLTVNAQSTCNNLPCGPLPWSVPLFPPLVSPTPMPTVQLTAVPTATPGPSPTSGPSETPAPTGTVFSDFSAVGDSLSTLNAVVNATDIPVEINGTAVNSDDQLATMAAGTTDFFSYVRGFSEVDLGGLGSIITFALSAFAIVLAVKAFSLLLPILTTIFGIVFRIADFVIGLFKV